MRVRKNSESGDNVFLEKLIGVHISDVHQRLSLDSLSKIVSTDQKISLVPYCLGERADYI